MIANTMQDELIEILNYLKKDKSDDFEINMKCK